MTQAKVGLETEQEARVRIAKDEPRMEITTPWDKKDIACMHKKDVSLSHVDKQWLTDSFIIFKSACILWQNENHQRCCINNVGYLWESQTKTDSFNRVEQSFWMELVLVLFQMMGTTRENME